MKNISNYIIRDNAKIIDGLKQINDNHSLSGKFTLFVIDNSKKVVGTVTDGDIRRGISSNKPLDEPITSVMQKSFQYLKKKFTPDDFKIAKEKGVNFLPQVDESMQIIKVYDLTKMNSLLPVEAVLMAVGRGKRLSPLTDEIPKPMLKIGDIPILEINIDRLISYGINTIYISVNYLSEKIINYFGDGTRKGIKIKYIKENKPLGTAGSLSLIKNIKSKHILVMNGDLLTDADFHSLYQNCISKNSEISIKTVPYHVTIPYGILKLKNDSVVGLSEKPSYTYYANSGIYMLKTSVLKNIPKNKFFDITELIELIIKKKKNISFSNITGYWVDIGKSEDYEYAKKLAKQIKKSL